tara:strand:+ start:5662 stop:6786 length:1125 start_codon:yes stop_codon:yes gene_type:complete
VAVAEETGWQIYRPEWYNGRVMETFISSPVVDKQGDLIPTKTIKEAMDFYMKYGVYSYRHEEMPIGLPLAYKIKNGKIKIRVGVHDTLPMHDKVWGEIKEFGPRGASSIRGEATDQEKICYSENDCHNRINELSLWSVSWVGDSPANPDAKVTDVSMAKTTLMSQEGSEADVLHTETPVNPKAAGVLHTEGDVLHTACIKCGGDVEKKIGKRGSKWCILHHRTAGKIGTPIPGGCHPTKAEAENHHRAILARRFGKSKALLAGIHKQLRLAKCENLLAQVKTMVEKKPKKPAGGIGNPPETWFNNCRFNARKIGRLPGRRQVRDERAWCSELWYNPGRFDQTYNKPDGTKGRTSGFELRNAVGRSSWNPGKPKG